MNCKRREGALRRISPSAISTESSTKKVAEEVIDRIKEIDIDCIPDSSYVAAFIAPRKHSIFREIGTTEKPDILAAKLAEGRVGILVDGSPIALTAPFILTEDFQSSEDYFVSPFMATIFRAIRFVAVIIALLLPAFYVTAQLFKMQLIPLGLMLNIASSVQGLPLSPSLEMFLVLLVLEVLKEASVRMPKYVGMALSIVGALVLGEAAVSAGISVHSRDHHRRLFGYLPLYRPQFYGDGQHSEMAVSHRRGQSGTVRNRAADRVPPLLYHQRGRLRNAASGAVLALSASGSPRFFNQI